MSLVHFIFGLLECLPDFFFIFSSVSCPRCNVEMRLLQKKAKLYRCPSCEELWVKRNKKLQPFISGGRKGEAHTSSSF
ncbi:MAG: zf-TFIIB domain-containing protein [Acidobacteria bacterium]|nr:zf-TFIIB domain-containing protein [Acidobacteriota bacterium]